MDGDVRAAVRQRQGGSPGAISSGFSAFLDVTRITAAMVVLLSHYGSGSITHSAFWVFNVFSESAVTVFFVLSGYMIAWVTEQREADGLSYAVARLCRIYSVVLPAIVLTVIFDLSGRAISPALYAGYSYFDTSFGFTQIFSSLFFLNQSWSQPIELFSNVPYWSLNYEVWYYAAFGIYCFWPAKRYRYAVLLLCALVAGSRIVTLAPVWLCGVAVRRIDRRHAIPRRWCLPVLIASILLVAAGDVATWGPWIVTPGSIGMTVGSWIAGHPPLWRYISALVIAAGFLAASGLTQEWAPPPRLWAAIRWLAGMTFSVYLFHRPMMLFLAATLPGSVENNGRRAAVLVITLLAITALSYVTERRKGQLKPLATALVQSIAGIKPSAPAPEHSSGAE